MHEEEGGYRITEEVRDFVDELCDCMTNYLTLHEKSDMREEEKLTAGFVDSVLIDTFNRNRKASEKEASCDVKGLDAMRQLAGCCTFESVREVLERSSAVILGVLRSPPIIELCAATNFSAARDVRSDSVAQRLGFEVLARACDERSTIQLRVALAQRWVAQHGALATVVTADAIQNVSTFLEANEPQLVEVLMQRSVAGSQRLPRASFAPAFACQWHLKPPALTKRRLGLDSNDRRIVRLCSLVWQLVCHGELLPGQLASSLVESAAIETRQIARMARGMLDRERRLLATGMQILCFRNAIDNPASDIADDLDTAQCLLSQFSLAEIYAFMQKGSALAARHNDAISSRALALMPGEQGIKTNYTKVAADAFLVLGAAVYYRRATIDVLPTALPLRLGDLLRTVARLRTEGVKHERTMLTLSDLKSAHRELRHELEHLAAAPNAFVRMTHCTRGGSKAHREVGFVFDDYRALSWLLLH